MLLHWRSSRTALSLALLIVRVVVTVCKFATSLLSDFFSFFQLLNKSIIVIKLIVLFPRHCLFGVEQILHVTSPGPRL